MATKANILSFTKAKAASRSGRVSRADSKRVQRTSTMSRSKNSSRSSHRNSSSWQSVGADALNRFEEKSLQRFEDPYDEEQIDPTEERSNNKRDIRRKKRTKVKAAKMFARQFASEDMPSENAPRAALYKGEMGAKQKKASRMQGSPTRFSLPSFSPAAFLHEKASRVDAGSSLSPFSIKVLTVVTCLVLICVFLYTPAQQYYHSQRVNARLSAEYASIENRNDLLNVQNDIMVSDAGIEDSVRQRYGYVRAGESLGIVVGLSEETTNSLRDSDHIEANVLSSSVKAPEEWYTPFLDALFGVE